MCSFSSCSIVMVQQFLLARTYLPFIFMMVASIAACLCLIEDTLFIVAAGPVTAYAMYSLVISDYGTNHVERHLWLATSLATLIVFQSVSVQECVVGGIGCKLEKFLSVLSIPIFLVAHVFGERNEVLGLINIFLCWRRTPVGVFNVIAFAITLIAMLILQLSRISRITLVYDKGAALTPVLRTCHILRADGMWICIGLIHIMIEFYRRHMHTTQSAEVAAAEEVEGAPMVV